MPGRLPVVCLLMAASLGQPAAAQTPPPSTGQTVDLVKDADGTDAYWCPMHPGVRSGTTGKCPICSMDLVPVLPSVAGEFRMDVTVIAGAHGRGLSGLQLRLSDPAGTPASGFVTVHEKALHLFVVGRDLEYFAHVHPEAAGNGRFVVSHQAPPGEYVIIADFLPANGTSQMLHRAVATPGLNRPAAVAAATPRADISDASAAESGNQTWGSAEKTVDGVRIRLEAADLIGGRIALLRFHLFNAGDGTPVADLEPFLGAPAHMLMATSTLTDAVHGHPEETDPATSVITFKPMMPPPGVAKLWLQFQRHGRITTVPFVIGVLEP
jgi:hypothetical protein